MGEGEVSDREGVGGKRRRRGKGLGVWVRGGSDWG